MEFSAVYDVDTLSTTGKSAISFEDTRRTLEESRFAHSYHLIIAIVLSNRPYQLDKDVFSSRVLATLGRVSVVRVPLTHFETRPDARRAIGRY
jgi:hypothetical protein